MKLKINNTVKQDEKVSVPPKRKNLKFKINAQPSTPQSTIKLSLNTKTSNNVSNSSDEYRVTADEYSRYSQKDHIYNITDSYCGSDEKTERIVRALDIENMKILEKEITLPQAVENIFVEISSNAGDNVARAIKNNRDPGEVFIEMTKKRITVRNGGAPIPIEINTKENMWAPEMIFGTLLTSSNYDKTKVRTECGRNGYGAKLTNIFSNFFQVTVGDPFNQKHYKQIWRDNMSIKEDPVITNFSPKSKAFVEVTYEMDFERFGYTEFPDEAFELFARHAADMSFTQKVPVTFNGHRFNIRKAEEYAKLSVVDGQINNHIVYYEWYPGTETFNKRGVNYARDKKAVPKTEICVVDTPDKGMIVSFVNGKWTHNNGVHADAAFKAISHDLLELVNNTGKKGKKKKRSQKLYVSDVKKHVTIIVNCWIEDPKFDSQYKAELKAPSPSFKIDEKILKPILKWELMARLYAELDAKNFRAASKSDGKKRRHINVTKLEDANKAGTVESKNCTLWVTEGDSAMAFAVKALGNIPRGRDYIGLFPLKGKPLNVMNASQDQIYGNDEINTLKEVLGIKERVNYLDDENFNELRYGHFMILADSDDDGKHILGLILNLFHCKYPSLLARNYVMYLRTKIVEIKKGKRKIKFYTQHEYDLWKEQNPDYKTWKHSYFKGLGSSEDEDIAEEFKAPKIVTSVYDNLAPYTLQLAFDSRLSDKRKDWLANWVPDYSVEQLSVQPISSFINHEFIQFSITDLSRSIPRFMDGLKTSQRKILWGAMIKWGAKIGKQDSNKMKVSRFASQISDVCAYKYGEKSLEGAIVSMAQDFIGSNNLPYLCRHGQMGTRSRSGKDAASSRYIYTKPEWWVPLVFRKEDKPLLNIVIDEGEEIEPVTFYPIIPMQLINGALGIGTGHSTFIPNYNPLDICYWLEAKILGCTLPEIKPWYREFDGEIEIKVKKPTPKTESEDEDFTETEEDSDDPDNVLTDRFTKRSMRTTGCFEITGNVRKKVIVKEIPVGRSIFKYKTFLDKLREEKKITRYDNHSTHDKPHFEIYGMKTATLRTLKLIKSYGLSNMVMLDNYNRPVKYKDESEILETFYHLRLECYRKRKEYIINNIGEKIKTLNEKIRFILAVIKGHEIVKSNPKITQEQANQQEAILVMGRNKELIKEQMERMGFDNELLKKVTLYQCTAEEVQTAKEEINDLEQEKKIKEETRPEDFWLSDLKEFVKAYCKHYKCKYKSPKPMSTRLVN